MSKSLLQKALEIKRGGGDIVVWYENLSPEEQEAFLREVETAKDNMLSAFRAFSARVHDVVVAVVEAMEPVLAGITE